MAIEKRELRKLLDEVSKLRGRHTELVSVYIPAGGNVIDASNQIFQERSTAENIKSKTTRKNVLAALEKIAGRLKHYSTPPPNGLVLLCGNISEKEGQVDIRLWEFEPPEKIAARIYRCDQTFVLDPLLEQVAEKEIYGLIVIDTKEAAIGFLKGKQIQVTKKLTSLVPGKQIKGGQSAARFARVREELLHAWQKEVGEVAKATFEQEKDLKGLIIGGPGIIKDEFFAGDFLPTDLKRKVIGVKDLGYSGEEGMAELVERAQDILKEAAIFKEKQLLTRFFEHLKKESGLVVYKEEQVKVALERAAVDTLIISEPREKKYAEFIKIAEQTGAKVEVVSADTPEGQSFFEIGGIGAILRYKF